MRRPSESVVRRLLLCSSAVSPTLRLLYCVTHPQASAVLGEAIGANEQLLPCRSGRRAQPTREIHEEEFESESEDYEEEQIPFEDDEDEILGANSFED